jgi:gentisate 1,2-dioxygenase
MIVEPAGVAGELDALYAEMARLHLEGLWRLGDEVQAERPRVTAQPYVWRGADIRRVLERAGELIQHSAAAERRTLRLVNPGLRAQHCATHTLAASVQLLRPGEVAPTHRHTPAAIRFVIQGHGAYTTVAGERCTMAPGDLVLTPRWAWHHHGNAGDEPVIWMDGLDFPLVILLQANFFERYPTGQQPETQPPDASLRRYSGALRPAWVRPAAAVPPLLVYRWEPTYTALQRLAQLEASPYDDVALEYTDPRTGGAVLPALGCWIQLLRPGVRTRAHRHTSSVVYHVFRGRGYSVIDGQRFDWEQGDFLALPGWAWHEHANPGEEAAILFSITDLPALEALDLYREEPYPGDGHQPLA